MAPKLAALQDQSRTAADFSHRVDKLAEELGVSVRRLGEALKELPGLPEKKRMSQRMIFAYKTGELTITKKAWEKLRAAEIAAGIAPENAPDEVRENPARFGPMETLQAHAAPVPRGQHNPAGRGVIAPHADFLPSPTPPSADDVRTYIEELLHAAAGDPARIARLMDELKQRFEETRIWWLRQPKQ